MSQSGEPILAINAAKKPSEMMIAHELFHLKLRSEGYAILVCDYTKPEWRARYHSDIEQIIARVNDPVQHAMFYGKMRAYGLDPTELTRDDLLHLFRDGRFPSNSPDYELTRALFYWRSNIELADRKLLAKLRTFYEQHGWQNEIKIAEPLIRLVKSSKLSSPEEEFRVSLQCMNVFLGSWFQLKPVGWRDDMMGNHRDHCAIVKLVTTEQP